MITISFYSYKGGVGRSLALTNLGVYLAQFGATVVLVDFDLEAPGIHYKIRPDSPLEVGQDGLVRLLASAGTTAAENLNYDIAIDVSEHVESPPVVEGDLKQPPGRLLLIPAGNPLEEAYWTDLSQIDWPRLFTGQDRPGVVALDALREHLVSTYEPDIVLIDSRTGITPAGGVATTLLPDVVVVLLLDTDEHRDGTRMVVSTIVRSSPAESTRIVPVLSRYTGSDFVERIAGPKGRRRVPPGQILSEIDVALDEIPLEAIREALVRDLDVDMASRVAQPLVLHADIALQQRERLSFGPYASAAAPRYGEALLDDYLRLFASLVPRDVVSRHLAGVRSSARGILLDRPDDAVRTLENLAGLVGDEEVFADLVKVYALRRDVTSMLAAAERLHHVHGSIVVRPEISRAMREMLSARSPRGQTDATSLRADFLEDYWRRAAPNDVEWGAGVASAMVAKGLIQRGGELCDELVSKTNDARVLAQLVSALARGDAEAERLAVAFALRHFELGESSEEFLEAAAIACRYQSDAELAARLLDVGALSRLSTSLAIDVLLAAGREAQAGRMLVDLLVDADFGDPRVERLAPQWISLLQRHKELRVELQERNPTMADYVETMRDEPWSTGQVGRPRYRYDPRY